MYRLQILNSVTNKERFPMPVIEDEIAKLSGQAFFVILNLASGLPEFQYFRTVKGADGVCHPGRTVRV